MDRKSIRAGEEGIFPVPGKAGTEPLQLPLLSSSADLKLLLRGAGSPLLHAVRVQQLGKKKLFLSHFLSLFFGMLPARFHQQSNQGEAEMGLAGDGQDPGGKPWKVGQLIRPHQHLLFYPNLL